MAKPIDHDKIKNVKRATMELMIESGYKGITVSHIAKRANVSPGYLYNHYSSVNELIKELLDSTYDKFLEYLLSMEICSVRDFVTAYCEGIVRISMEDPMTVQFVTAIMDDHAFFNERIQNKVDFGIEDHVRYLLDLGHSKYEIGKHIGPIEFTTIMIRFPFSYLHSRFMFEHDYGSLNENDIGTLSRMMWKALQ